LDKKLADVAAENFKLGEYIKRVGKAREALVEPLHISKQCLANRSENQFKSSVLYYSF